VLDSTVLRAKAQTDRHLAFAGASTWSTLMAMTRVMSSSELNVDGALSMAYA